MMGKKDGQTEMIILTSIDALIPESHLLRKINRHIDFSFVYEKSAPYYSDKGRPSIDPVCLIKMLLVGYLYGVKSERRLTEDIALNLAYRWFCGFELSDKIPNHSLFSQNRRRRFSDDKIFREIFNHIVRECMEKGIITGENVVSDGSFIPVNVAADSFEKIEQEVEQSTVKYLDALDEELSQIKGYKESKPTTKIKNVCKSTTDPDCGYINQEHKKGLGYLTEMTVDTDSGIVLGVDCYPANRRESDILLKHIDKIQTETGVSIKKLALDAGYDVGAIHRGLEILGITGFVSCIDFSYDILKRNLKYSPKLDCFECLAGKTIDFVKLTYKKSTQNYYRLYRMSAAERKCCLTCEHRSNCEFSKTDARINASPFYPAFWRNRQRYETAEYKAMKRLRGIWAEGAFSILKREHNLARTKKRGLLRVSEECLLSALALNLKRMVRAIDKRKSEANAAVVCAVWPFLTIFSPFLDFRPKNVNICSA